MPNSTILKDIDAVVFDMDGLMLDTEPIYRQAWQQAAADLDQNLDNDFYKRMVGRSNEDCDRLMVEQFGPHFPIHDCRTLRDRHWRTIIQAQGIALRPGLLELLDLLEMLSVPKAIATASIRAEANIGLTASGIVHRFQSVTTGDEVPRNKPAPDIYLEAARKLNRHPHRCLAFEDSNTGATAASTAGLVTVMVPDLQSPTDRVASAVTAILPSLHEAKQLLADAWLQ